MGRRSCIGKKIRALRDCRNQTGKKYRAHLKRTMPDYYERQFKEKILRVI